VQVWLCNNYYIVKKRFKFFYFFSIKCFERLITFFLNSHLDVPVLGRYTVRLCSDRLSLCLENQSVVQLSNPVQVNLVFRQNDQTLTGIWYHRCSRLHNYESLIGTSRDPVTFETSIFTCSTLNLVISNET
jgi:hypothetical protein